MRARYTTAQPPVMKRKITIPEPGIHRNEPARPQPPLTIAGLPPLRPYEPLSTAWKTSHTKALLAGLGDVDRLVVRTLRSIGTQRVLFDGLVHFIGDGVLDLAASVAALPNALRLFDIFLRALAQRGVRVKVTSSTVIEIAGETLAVRLREGSERRDKRPNTPGFQASEYFPTGQLWFSVVDHNGSKSKTQVSDSADIEAFLNKVNRLAQRMPRLREQRRKRVEIQDEKVRQMQARWKEEADDRRQWTEQQVRFNEISSDIEQWTKAQSIRAYAAAVERHAVSTQGTVEVGSVIDGWLRWIHWYAERLDPITRREGPKQGPSLDK